MELIILYGIVRWFDNKKGYGFIVNANKQDFFVHYTAINHNGYKELAPGDVVSFESRCSLCGMQAINVHRLLSSNI